MSKNKIGEDSPIPKIIYLKIRRRDGVESLTTLEEGEFKVPIDGCIKVLVVDIQERLDGKFKLIRQREKKCFLTHSNVHYQSTAIIRYLRLYILKLVREYLLSIFRIACLFETAL